MSPSDPPSSRDSGLSGAPDSTDPTSSDSGAAAHASAVAGPDRERVRLESRLARLEAQLRAIEERLGELQGSERARKQRALWLRLVLLLVLVGLFFVMQATGAFE